MLLAHLGACEANLLDFTPYGDKLLVTARLGHVEITTILIYIIVVSRRVVVAVIVR